MKRLVALIILVPVAIVLVAFSVANRGDVTISLDPFNAAAPVVAVALPLFVLLFATLAVGVIIGGVAAGSARAIGARKPGACGGRRNRPAAKTRNCAPLRRQVRRRPSLVQRCPPSDAKSPDADHLR